MEQQHDFELQNEGSIFLLRPVTDAARVWCDEHMPVDGPMFGSAHVIEHGYVAHVVQGLVDDGYKFAYHDNAARPS